MNNEQNRVSKSVKRILDHSHQMFKHHLYQDQQEDAIAIGDEYLEWIKDLDSQEIFYYNQNELEELYNQLKRQRKKRK